MLFESWVHRSLRKRRLLLRKEGFWIGLLEFCCVAMKKSIKREKTKPSAALDLFCNLPSHFKRFLNFSDVRSFLSLTVKKGHTSLKRNVQGLNWLAENHAKTLDGTPQMIWNHVYGKHLIQVHCFPSLRTADAFPVVAFSEGEKRRPEMRLLFAGYGFPY